MTEVMWLNGKYYPTNRYTTSSNSSSNEDNHKVNGDTLILN